MTDNEPHSTQTHPLVIDNGSNKQISRNLVAILDDLLNQKIAVRVQVTGNSMRPFLQGGEFVTLRRVRKEALRIGDIVLFVNVGNFLVMHRIVHRRLEAGRLLLQTNGDAVRMLDPPIDASQVLGRVDHITRQQMDLESGYPEIINLVTLWRRTQAAYLARRNLFRFYFYRFRKLLATTLRLS